MLNGFSCPMVWFARFDFRGIALQAAAEGVIVLWNADTARSNSGKPYLTYAVRHSRDQA